MTHLDTRVDLIIGVGSLILFITDNSILIVVIFVVIIINLIIVGPEWPVTASNPQGNIHAMGCHVVSGALCEDGHHV